LINGDMTGFSVARIRVIDQEGNSSNINDPNATTAFVVDTTAPRVIAATPAPLSQVSSSGTTVKLTINKNLDPASVNTSTVKVTRSGGDGIFGNANDVPVPITGLTLSPPQPFTGIETISFNIPGPLVGDLYEITLVGTGKTTVTDIPGNAIDGEFNGVFPSGNGTAGGNFNLPFLVFNPASARMVFVGGSQFVTDPTQPQGSRANPFPTIAGGIGAANVGDTVAVLPGVYQESVTLKNLVKVLGADPSSTDVSFVPGSALQTIIAPPVPAKGALVGVLGVNLISIGQVSTELSGFSILDPLQGNPSNGPITPGSVGIMLLNSNALIDKNYIIDADMGINLVTTGTTASTSTIADDVVAGNNTGIVINDMGSATQSLKQPYDIANNDIVSNTIGINILDTSPTVGAIATVENNIFANNNDLSAAQNGAAIVAAVAGKTLVRYNMFGGGNGPAGGNPGNITVNVGGGFDPSVLSRTTPDARGNFLGNPAFQFPRDPRPNADGPAVFLTDANFDLQGSSDAIDNALNASAPALDFLYRSRVKIDNRGFPGHGPADVGAFEFQGTGGAALGGAFRVTSTALVTAGPLTNSRALTINQSSDNALIVSFSQNVNGSTVNPFDVVLSGNGLNPTNPATPSGLTWIDGHTVEFFLSGGFASSGAVQVSISGGQIQDMNGDTLPAYGTQIGLNITGSTTTTTSTSTQGSGSSTGPSGPTSSGTSYGAVTRSASSDSSSTPVPLGNVTSAVVPLATTGEPAGNPVPQTSVTVTPDQPRSSGLRGLLGLFRRSKR
jgi:hypothetical protein